MKFNKIDYDRISSTNDEGKRLILEGRTEPLLILAKQQLKGRGRGDHTWESSHIGNIYSSYCFCLGSDIRDVPQLTLISSLAVVRALIRLFHDRKVREYRLSIKWPNDILLNEKKIVGILTELAQKNKDYHAIVGIGINVDWSKDDILKKGLPFAGAVSELVSKDIKMQEVQTLVEEELGKVFEEFLAGSRFHKYFDEYNRFLLNNNKTLLYELDNRMRTGFCLGIDKEGYLLIKNHFDQVDRVGFGEVNIKGVYGY